MSLVSPGDIAAVLAAVALAALGGEAFLKGVLGVAGWLRMPKLLVATTLAAFATSSPELTVSSVAALSGQPEIGLGDALGSNVVNIALIFGLALLFGPIKTERQHIGRDFGLALAAPALTWMMLSDGNLSRYEGGLLLAMFVVWMLLTIRSATAQRQPAIPGDAQAGLASTMAYSIGGLLALVTAGRLFVSGASNIGAALGLDPYIIGATVVAIGTSLPELVTVLLARWRGHDDIGIGTLLGSNLFNGLAIVGVAASLHPIQADMTEVTAALFFGIAAVLLTLPNRDGLISRRRGFMLLACYGAFVLTTIAAGRGLFF
ncbi:MAG: sodium:calcium antiporter [Dechloromonas sp.]|nr:sodium:calcium antiporter [Dechloromonas sp.]